MKQNSFRLFFQWFRGQEREYLEGSMHGHMDYDDGQKKIPKVFDCPVEQTRFKYKLVQKTKYLNGSMYGHMAYEDNSRPDMKVAKA